MAQRVLCVVSHPDDETMLTGGTLAMLAKRGLEIHVLCATRGQGGEPGDPPIVERTQLGATREQELRCAARALGITGVHLLDYRDPPVGSKGQLFPYTHRPDELIQQITTVVRQLQPALLITHGSDGEYHHPAHILTHRAVLEAHILGGAATTVQFLYTFCAAIPGREDRIFNLSDPADIVLDVTPWLLAKAEAAACHRTQHGLFFRNHPQATNLLEVVRTVESLHRVWPEEAADFPAFLPYRVQPPDDAEQSTRP